MQTKTLAEKRQADFENLQSQPRIKTEAMEQSQSKPMQTETQAKNLESPDEPETQTAKGRTKTSRTTQTM